MRRVVLITGGNLGPVAENLGKARALVAREVGTVVAESSVRRSEAWGFCAPEPFLNQVLVVETALAPEEVLLRTQAIETHLGRRRPEQGAGAEKTYASRTMDIDILFYGDEVIDTPALRVPHPLVAQRSFVLEPLCEVMPEFRHPVLGETIRALRDAAAAKEKTKSR